MHFETFKSNLENIECLLLKKEVSNVKTALFEVS